MIHPVKAVRIPRQKRGVKTRQRIVRAAIRLFSEKGYYNTSSNEIAAQSGVSIGSFYAYFTDKKQVFLEALKYYNESILKEIKPVSAFKGKNMEGYLSDFINNILQAHKIYPEFHREITAMQLLDPDIRKIITQQEKSQLDYAYKYIKAAKEIYGNQIKIENLRTGSFIIFNSIESAIHAIVFNESKMTENSMVQELVNMILKYMLCDLPENAD